MSYFSSIETCISDMSARLGTKFTDEQIKFMSDFTVPTISFSSPGTGKTKSAVAGLILAETFHQIPGSNIYACSFTNASTGELRHRHEVDCHTLGMTASVNFSTIHSLCNGIIRENYKLLGMRRFNNTAPISLESIAGVFESVGQNFGFTVNPRDVRPVVNACRKLNASLVFDEAHVRESYDFKTLRMDYEKFAILRKALYQLSKNMDTVTKDDIMLYTLEILLKNREVSDEFKKKCRILLVDEFQDLSLLELRVITLLSDCVIAIGDIKQQIYAFQGACQDIVEEYHKYFPNARVANLNKSWRCSDEIVEYSKGIIAPNNMDEQGFISMGKKGSVKVVQGLSLSDLCDEIERDYRENRNTLSRDSLFLFRNNYSVIPIAEEFFKRKVPCRVNKYIAASTIPVIKDLMAVVELAIHPMTITNLAALKFILPEMQDYRDVQDSPLYKIMSKQGGSVFEVNYNFRNPMQAKEAMYCLMQVADQVASSAPMRNILNTIYPLYQEVWLKKREHFLEMPARYYINMVQPLVQSKTYHRFAQDEVAKSQAIAEANNRGIGVRCYTFHASKGLEAEDVYMLDCDAGICPNTRQLDKMDAIGCAMEKARDIRNERSLLFVAATRAKENLVVAYNGELSPLLSDYNVYQQYDQLYKDFRHTYEDAESFEKFIGM